MGFWTLVLVGLSLAMDAFAIAVANGIAHQGDIRQAFNTALAFGVAQGIMPLLGFWLGAGFSELISDFDHWIAFGLLLIIGGKMVIEGIKELRENCPAPAKPLSGRMLFMQAVATSIDALAVGVSFAALSVNIISAAAIIAVVTFLCCVLGAVIGSRWGCRLKKGAVICGGIILILIGTKILVEHLGVI